MSKRSKQTALNLASALARLLAGGLGLAFAHSSSASAQLAVDPFAGFADVEVQGRVEDGFGAGRNGGPGGRAFILRTPLDAMVSDDALLTPYAGLGFGRGPSGSGDMLDSPLSGRFVAGVGAPIAGGLEVYGEYQNVQPLERGDGDAGMHRGLIGIRSAF